MPIQELCGVGKKMQRHINMMSIYTCGELGRTDEAWLTRKFGIIGTSANKLVESIHDRMPVILYLDTFNLWLSHNMHDPEQLQPLYLPLPAEEMTVHKVPDLVNNPRFDSPACIAQV